MTDADIRELVRHGATIEAIRRHRARHGGTLLAARAAVEALRWEFTQASRPALSAFEAELDRLLRDDQKIEAIKRFREVHGVGLKEAKDAIDARAEARERRR
ncbi:ribosomal protein L7/L12 [Nannocystis bainbridge]|uniref:Ribosomal protein L7/L12 n=1 Tax=Nannocystis bainbridge TaxID=2995303 RepID=A0ABT5E198_9BACT|nr:ribosomal protein L7/L12 [Nannocystis bainbridge]MDC0719595.1 ribosomal protein L7/L12 [Nannocystis bainbridge]